MKKSYWVGIVVLLTKVGGKLLPKVGAKLLEIFPKLLKGGKAVKGGLFAGSAGAYTSLFGWKAALMILALLFFHESGHLWAMKRRGMKTKGMYFIPFLGAAAVPDEEFPSREAENYVALMGPTVGLVLSGLAYVGYFLTDDLEFTAAAGWMALINLLNLLPIMPLDGGRVLRSIAFSSSSWQGIVITGIGMAVGIIAAVVKGLWLFVALIPIGILEVLWDFRKEREDIRQREYLELINRMLENEAKNRMIDFSYWAEFRDHLKLISIKPKMSAIQIIKRIVWTLVLAGSLFLILHSVTAVTGDQSFFGILK